MAELIYIVLIIISLIICVIITTNTCKRKTDKFTNNIITTQVDNTNTKKVLPIYESTRSKCFDCDRTSNFRHGSKCFDCEIYGGRQIDTFFNKMLVR
jgi:hypothetical protein